MRFVYHLQFILDFFFVILFVMKAAITVDERRTDTPMNEEMNFSHSYEDEHSKSPSLCSYIYIILR